MQGGVVAMVAGSLVLGSPSVGINVGTGNNARAPVAVGKARKLAWAMATWDARWETSGSLRVGRRVRGGRGESVRVFALQQSAKSVKWVLDPCGGEVNAERDLEMGTMNGGQGVVADYDDAHREGNDLEVSEEDEAVLGDRSNQHGAHVPAIKESMVQLETMAKATEAETERARVSVGVDVAHPTRRDGHRKLDQQTGSTLGGCRGWK